MKPTVLEWIKCLHFVVPFFKEIAEINHLLDSLLTLNSEMDFKPIERLYERGPWKSIPQSQTRLFWFLLHFNSVRWPRFEKTVQQLITSNNNLSFGNYRNYQTFFYRILKNVISYAHIMNADVQLIQNLIDMYVISRIRNLKIDLEIAINDVRNDIKELNDQIKLVVDLHLNAQTMQQFSVVMLNVDNLIGEKDEFKNKWSTLTKVFLDYGDSVVEQLKKRKNIVEKIHQLFGSHF